MDKHILEQYTSMQEEQKDLRRRTEKLRRRMDAIRESGIVADTVSCGKRGKKPLGTKKVEGFPVQEYQHQSGLAMWCDKCKKGISDHWELFDYCPYCGRRIVRKAGLNDSKLK